MRKQVLATHSCMLKSYLKHIYNNSYAGKSLIVSRLLSCFCSDSCYDALLTILTHWMDAQMGDLNLNQFEVGSSMQILYKEFLRDKISLEHIRDKFCSKLHMLDEEAFSVSGGRGTSVAEMTQVMACEHSPYGK